MKKNNLLMLVSPPEFHDTIKVGELRGINDITNTSFSAITRDVAFWNLTHLLEGYFIDEVVVHYYEKEIVFNHPEAPRSYLDLFTLFNSIVPDKLRCVPLEDDEPHKTF